MEKSNIKRKLAFASADILGGGSFNIINFLYPGFLALVIGLNPFLCAAILFISKIFDAIIDPVVGFISDKTKSRWGKRRVYLIFVSPLIAVGLYFLFFPYSFSSEALRVTACLTSYLIFTVIQSFLMIPYYSLGSEISSDYRERASFNSYRLGFSIFSSILCVAVPGLIIDTFKAQHMEDVGYQVMSVSFGLLFAVSVLITGLFAKEEISTPPTTAKFSFKDIFKPLKMKPYRLYLLMFMLVQISMAIMSGLFFFYIDFYILKDITFAGESSMYGLIAAALMFAMQIVALPLFMKLIDRKNKAFVYRFGAIIWIVLALVLIFIPANFNPIFIVVLAALMGFGISGPGLAPHAMFGDIVDYGELEFKERLDGQMGGFTNFANQISQAIGLGLAMLILGWAGFKEQDPRPGAEIINYQDEPALLALKLIMALTPLLFMSVGIFLSYKYKIDAKEHQRIKSLLDESHEKETKKDEEQA